MTSDRDHLMSPLQAAVWQFLLAHFSGAEGTTPRAVIISRYNLLRGTELDDRTFRQVVSELVTVFKKPICTSPGGGYFVANTARELNAAINYLKSAGSAFFERAKSLEEADPLERQENLF